MFRSRSTNICFAPLVVVCVSVFVWSPVMDHSLAVADDFANAAGIMKSVDDDMHHFMEYVFEPNYKRLKVVMANEPKEKKSWKAVKGDSLTLAECANLLLTRVPDKDADEWRKLSIAVRTQGGELYAAARKADYSSAHKAYRMMLKNCNACHKNFAGGKHQLQP